MQNATHLHSINLPTTPSTGADPQDPHATAVLPSSLDKQQTLPASRKRKDRGVEEEYSRKTAKRQRTPSQASSALKAPTPAEILEHENTILPDDRSTSTDQDLSHPASDKLQQAGQQHSSTGSLNHRTKTRKCRHFFIDRLRQKGPFPRAFVDTMLRYLGDLDFLDDLLRTSPHELFDTARIIIDNYYQSITYFENLDWKRNTPTGNRWVGKIGLFVVPLQRGDPSRLDKSNKQLLPGPQNTDIVIKVTPGLIIKNDHREHIDVKLFTTKHNTDPEKLRSSGRLERDYVLMCRTSGEKQMEDSSCFTSLDFVGTSESYDWLSPSYMEVDSVCSYPRHGPMIVLGHLVSNIENLRRLDTVLTESGNRLTAANRQKIRELESKTLASPTLSPLNPPPMPVALASSQSASPSTQIDDTVVPKVYFFRD